MSVRAADAAVRSDIGALSRLDRGAHLTTWQTIKHGLLASPEFREGLAVTVLLAIAATGGRVIVPIVVQQVIDKGIAAPGGPNLGVVRWAVAAAAVAVLLTAFAGYLMNVRLYRTTEGGLRALRVKAFRHVQAL